MPLFTHIVALLVALGAFCGGFSFAAYAATSYSIASEAIQTITEFSVCRIVENQSSFKRNLFIGTKTAAEWESFYTYPPNRVSAAGCTVGAGVAATWGLRGWGSLGDGIVPNTPIPTLLPGAGSWRSTTWKKVMSGGLHTCGILTDDTIRCWGYNGNGQLGDGTSISRELPVTLYSTWATTTWSDVSSYNQTTCAIRKTDSYLFCWGYNNWGQVGDNTVSNRVQPTALYATGGWSTTAWKQVAVGANHVCALRSSDSVMFCWGYNLYGQVGNGTMDVYDEESTNPSYPAPLTGAFATTSWSYVGVGSNHTCGIRTSDSRMYCWGYNNYGQLGGGASGTNSATPAALTSTGGWNTTAFKSLSAGDYSTCGVRTDNTTVCWGYNGHGRLGNGNSTSYTSPQLLDVANDWDTVTWTKVVMGPNSTCGIRASDSKLYCWGYNLYGQLGNGSTANASTPTPLALSDNWNAVTWKDITVGSSFVCGLQTDNTAACWGLSVNGQLAGLLNRNYPSGLDRQDGWETTTWSKMSTGGVHACGIRTSDSKIGCWGQNSYGQLGGPSALGSGSFTPQLLTTTGGWDAVTWKDVQAGNEMTCGIKLSDNTMACWGRGAYGGLGDGTNTNHTTPAPLTATGGFSTMAWDSIAVGTVNLHMCAIRATNYYAYCWGLNSYGNLGIGTTTPGDYSNNTPQALSSTGGWATTAWKQLATGYRNTCGIRRTDNRMFCWGDNGYGQLGTGNSTDSNVPVALSSTGGWDTTTWKSVAVGYLSVCAIRMTDNVLFCWGYNAYGQIGDGSTTNRNVPTALTATDGFSTMTWKQVSVGHSPNRTCAIRLSNNAIYCWGDNRYGELGDGTETSHTTPAPLTATNGWSTKAWASVSVGNTFVVGITQ